MLGRVQLIKVGLFVICVLGQTAFAQTSDKKECALFLSLANRIRRVVDFITSKTLAKKPDVVIEVEGHVAGVSVGQRFPYAKNEAHALIAEALKYAMSDQFLSLLIQQTGLNSAQHISISVKETYIKGFPKRFDENQLPEARTHFTVLGHVRFDQPSGKQVQLPFMLGVDASHPNASSKSPTRALSFATGEGVRDLRRELDFFQRTKHSSFIAERRPLSVLALTILNSHDYRIAIETNEAWNHPARLIAAERELLLYYYHEAITKKDRAGVNLYERQLRQLDANPESWFRMSGIHLK